MWSSRTSSSYMHIWSSSLVVYQSSQWLCTWRATTQSLHATCVQSKESTFHPHEWWCPTFLCVMIASKTHRSNMTYVHFHYKITHHSWSKQRKSSIHQPMWIMKALQPSTVSKVCCCSALWAPSLFLCHSLMISCIWCGLISFPTWFTSGLESLKIFPTMIKATCWHWWYGRLLERPPWMQEKLSLQHSALGFQIYIASEKVQMTTETHSIWTSYITPTLLKGWFVHPQYYKHFMKLVWLLTLCL